MGEKVNGQKKVLGGVGGVGKEHLRKSQRSEKRKERLRFGALLFRDHLPPHPQAFVFLKNPLLCEKLQGTVLDLLKFYLKNIKDLRGK